MATNNMVSALPTVPTTILHAPRPPAPSLDEIHLALSEIVIRRHPSPAGPSPVNEHLELLKLLALLLVTEDSGDVAAVTFRVISQHRLELHYAKNRPCTTAERAYIRDIFDVLRDTAIDSTMMYWKILALVIPVCKKKIKSRTDKICLRLRQLLPSFSISDSACSPATETRLRETMGQSTFPASATVPEFLRAWFHYLLNQPKAVTSNWHVGSVHHMLHLAYHIGNALDIEHVLDTQLLRRVRKLGDYYGATITVISNAKQLPPDQLRNLRIVEVVAPTPTHLFLQANPVNTVNSWARHIGEPEISEADLRKAYPEITHIPATSLARQTICVHCECTLLLGIIRPTEAPIAINAPLLLEMGVSKSSCFMCREFIAAVQKLYRHIRVRVSSSHGKHVAGWSLPRSTPEELKIIMNKRVFYEMDEVLQRVTRKRKSDSVSRASGLMPSAEQVFQMVRDSGGSMFSLGNE